MAGAPLLSVTLPMPPSHRERPRTPEAKADLKRRKKAFIDACTRKLGRFSLDGRRFILYARFGADWLKADGDERRRDIPNLLPILSDETARALHIDDKRWRNVVLDDEQIDGCSKEDEFVVVKIYRLG